MRKKEKVKDCIAYLSVECSPEDVEKKETLQLAEIRRWAKAHRVNIVGEFRRNGMGLMTVARHFDVLADMAAKKRVDGVVIWSTGSVADDIADVYAKAAKLHKAGGVLISVREGELRLSIEEDR